MEEMNNEPGAIKYATASTMNSIMSKIFLWMFLGLGVSAITGFLCIGLIATGTFPVWAVYVGMLLEIFLVIGLSARINKMSFTAAKIWFLVYAVVSGFTLTPIFIVYDVGILSFAFIGAAAMFGTMGLIGLTTKKDLSTYGSVGLMLLVGILVTTLLNVIFFKSTGLELFLLYAGLAVFAGITAWDMQRFKALASHAEQSNDQNLVKNVVILGALELYLDFINIFIRLVSILGRKKN